jgi:uncharacterized membrane protein
LHSFFRSHAAAYILLPTAAACWSGNHIIARAIAGIVPPASLSVARWLVVALILGLVGPHLLIADWRKLKAKIGALTFLALIGGAAFGTLQYVALQYTTAINMGVVGSVSPAFIVAASFLLFGDRMSLRQLLGVAVSLIGVLAIVTRLQPDLLLSLSFNGGDLMILANMVLWSVYCACLRRQRSLRRLGICHRLSAARRRGDARGDPLCRRLHVDPRLRLMEPRHRADRRAARQRLPAHHPAVRRRARNLDPGRDAAAPSRGGLRADPRRRHPGGTARRPAAASPSPALPDSRA